MLLHVAVLVLSFASAHATASAPEDQFVNVNVACENVTVLPEPTGHHQVGRSNFFFVDSDREETATEDPHDLRQIAMTLWYPAVRTDTAPPTPYMPGLEAFLSGFAADRRDMLREIGASYRPLGCVVAHAFENIAVSDLDDEYPVIVFSPGGTMSRYWYSAMAQQWASEGFVVAMIGHAHSGTDVYPRDGLHFDPLAWRAPEDASEAEAGAIEERLTDMLAGDAIFVLNRLTDIEAGRVAHPLSGRIDLDRVALAGHSRGGNTVSRGCRTEPRFDACVTFDNVGNERDVAAALERPQLTIRTAWGEQRTERLVGYLVRNSSWAVDAVLPSADHMSFSDMPIVQPTEETDVGVAKAFALDSADMVLAFLEAVWNADMRNGIAARLASIGDAAVTEY